MIDEVVDLWFWPSLCVVILLLYFSCIKGLFCCQVHVWGGISYHGRTGICIFSGIMDSEIYQQILETNLLPFARQAYPDGYRLYQVNTFIMHTISLFIINISTFNNTVLSTINLITKLLLYTILINSILRQDFTFQQMLCSQMYILETVQLYTEQLF